MICEGKNRPGLEVWNGFQQQRVGLQLRMTDHAPATGREAGLGDGVRWPSSQFTPSALVVGSRFNLSCQNLVATLIEREATIPK
jgi:hypothetical protein